MVTPVQRPFYLLVLVLVVFLSACADDADSGPFVDLGIRQPVTTDAQSDDVLRVAVAAVLSPEANLQSYVGLADYLSEHLERPVELVQRRTYAEINDLVARGAVDLAFVCTSAFVVGSDRGEMELLVVPEVGGETLYYSTVIISSSSDRSRFDDLRGASFAFTDPMSNSGRAYPTFLVQQMDETPDSFFSSTMFTYSHDRAIAAVADGVVDAAAVDSLVLDAAMVADPDLASRLKVIHQSPPFGIPPVVVPATLDPTLGRQLRDLLLGLADEPGGPAILAQMGVDRFVPGDPAEYESARILIGSIDIDS
jgi:phosphonate transport system substrate-binding protein